MGRIDHDGAPLDERLADHVEELVELWHLRGVDDMGLAAWLGLSRDEYAATGGGDHGLPLRWRLFPPDPRTGWETTFDELSDNRWDQVVGGLWVGGYEIGHHGPDLDDFDLVVTLDSSVAEIDPVDRDVTDELTCFFDDRDAPDEDAVAPVVALAAAAWQAGASVLVRCAYGQNRSCYVAARILHACGWPAAHAVHRLRQVRGLSALENRRFVAVLRALDGGDDE